MKVLPAAVAAFLASLTLLTAAPAGAQDSDALLERLGEAQQLMGQNRSDEAERRLRALAEELTASQGEAASDTAITNALLAEAIVNQGRAAEGEALYRRVLDQLAGASEPAVLAESHTLHSLSMMLFDQGRLDEALEAADRATKLRVEAEGEDSGASLVFMTDQALVLKSMGRHEEADVLYRRVVAVREATRGPNDPALATALRGLAVNLVVMERAAEAEPLLRRSLALDEANYGEGYPPTRQTLSALATVLAMQGRLETAEAMQRRVLVAFGDEQSAARGEALGALGHILLSQGKLDEAAAVQDEALVFSRRLLGDQDPETAAGMIAVASVRLRQDRPAEAAALLEQAIETIRVKLPTRPAVRVRPLFMLAQAEESQGLHDAARRHLEEARLLANETLPEGHTTRISATANVGVALSDWGDPAAGLPLLREAGAALLEETRSRGGFDSQAIRNFADLRPVFRATVRAAWRVANPPAVVSE